ncbi:hypothetical protein HDV02_006695 [Globomyces sp. JEL0801]|nr:hypothetical protein HDV02_006695 [Globomyces sp. JEL0801]
MTISCQSTTPKYIIKGFKPSFEHTYKTTPAIRRSSLQPMVTKPTYPTDILKLSSYNDNTLSQSDQVLVANQTHYSPELESLKLITPMQKKQIEAKINGENVQKELCRYSRKQLKPVFLNGNTVERRLF